MPCKRGLLLASSLRAELMAIDGIAAAELEGNEEAPLGVRVQLAAGADAETVGVAVEQVLANHGMRSQRPGAEPATEVQVSDRPGAGPPPPPGAAGEAAILPIRGALGTSVETVVAPPVAPQLESVAVEESRAGTSVRVSVGGRVVSRQVGSASDGRDAAIVAAVAEALEAEADLLAVQRSEAGEARIVIALLEMSGNKQRVGSAVVTGGEAYALAHAAWKALTAPE